MPHSASTEELVTYMVELRVIIFIECASLALLVYDYLLTSGQEIGLVWRDSPWNLGRVLFFLTRYLGFVGAFLSLYVDTARSLTLPGCAKLTQVTVFVIMGEMFVAEVILTLRVWALWRRKRIVTLILLGSCTALVATGIWQVTRIHLSQNDQGEVLHATFRVCPPYYGSASSLGFIILVAYESGESVQRRSTMPTMTLSGVIFSLTAVQAWGSLWRQPESSILVRVFFTDGLCTNFSILSFCIANAIIRYRHSSVYVNLLTSLLPTVHSILTSRMMLNLKESAIRSASGGLSFHTYSDHMSSIQFERAASPIARIRRRRHSSTLIPENFDHARSWFGET
ncbi:hypothetical protein WG66_010800 [Moniliophthora roreri]|nr:hypothetical protein WG66_010800 [Moniliophthora roreri]